MVRLLITILFLPLILSAQELSNEEENNLAEPAQLQGPLSSSELGVETNQALSSTGIAQSDLESRPIAFLDLEQQTRMADATEDLVEWAEIQVWLSMSGIFILVLTLVATSIAAIFTGKMTRQNRAYMTPGKSEAFPYSTGRLFHHNMINTGDSPAINCEMLTRMEWLDGDRTLPPKFDREMGFENIGNIVGKGQELNATTVIPEDVFQLVLTGEMSLFYHCVVRYSDIHKRTFLSRITGRVHPTFDADGSLMGWMTYSAGPQNGEIQI